MKESKPELQKVRTLGDAELIQGGAEYKETKGGDLVLDLTPEHMESARGMMERELLAKIESEMDELKVVLRDAIKKNDWVEVGEIAELLATVQREVLDKKLELADLDASKNKRDLAVAESIRRAQKKISELEKDPKMLEQVFEVKQETFAKGGYADLMRTPEDLLNFLHAEIRTLELQLL